MILSSQCSLSSCDRASLAHILLGLAEDQCWSASGFKVCIYPTDEPVGDEGVLQRPTGLAELGFEPLSNGVPEGMFDLCAFYVGENDGYNPSHVMIVTDEEGNSSGFAHVEGEPLFLDVGLSGRDGDSLFTMYGSGRDDQIITFTFQIDHQHPESLSGDMNTWSGSMTFEAKGETVTVDGQAQCFA